MQDFLTSIVIHAAAESKGMCNFRAYIQVVTGKSQWHVPHGVFCEEKGGSVRCPSCFPCCIDAFIV